MPKKHQFPQLDPDQIHIQSPDAKDEFFDVRKAALFLSISNSGMRRLQQERWVPYFKIGRCVRFSRKDLEAYVAKRRIEARDGY